MTGCTKIRPSRCPEFPILNESTVNDILDLADGDSDIKNWVTVHSEYLDSLQTSIALNGSVTITKENQVLLQIPPVIYEKLIYDYQEKPYIEDDMDRLLKLWEKLDNRNE